MFLKLLKSTSQLIVVVTTLGALHFSAAAYADDFQFFSKGVDYWNDLSSETPSAKKELIEKAQELPKAGASEKDRFPWEHYTDPKNKAFFKEGDYTPPEPFMELVRNPSDDNLKMWFAYMEKKNELSERLQSRMNEYLAQNALTLPKEKKALVTKHTPGATKVDTTRYRFRMYFSSTCPHCKKMVRTLSELQSKGFFVEARQIDKSGEAFELPFPTVMATVDEMKAKDIKSVPLLLIGDLKRKVVYRLTGYQTVESVMDVISKERDKM